MKPQDQQEKPQQQTNANKSAEQDQSVSQPQPKEAQEDRSKSFGESQVGRESTQPKGETGIIPKENSFPNYKEEVPRQDETLESYKH